MTNQTAPRNSKSTAFSKGVAEAIDWFVINHSAMNDEAKRTVLATIFRSVVTRSDYDAFYAARKAAGLDQRG